ncbi:MAG TPA: preprotein translocase subunit SecG [Spirochaetales bacterium]|nr:preprotein translocase subunit SecG [Spirochaetales bacterium]
MTIVSGILLVIFVISSLLLIAIVLIQDEQGEGMGGLFGGGSSTPFGSRSGNVLTRMTSILGAIFILTSFGLAWMNRTPESGDVVGAARRQQTAETTLEWWKTEPKTEETQQPAPSTLEAPVPAPTDQESATQKP